MSYYESEDFLLAHKAKLANKKAVKGARFPIRTPLESVKVQRRTTACLVCFRPVYGFWRAEGDPVCCMSHFRRLVAEQGGKVTINAHVGKWLAPPVPKPEIVPQSRVLLWHEKHALETGKNAA